MAPRIAKARYKPIHQGAAVKKWGDKKTSITIDDPTGILLGQAVDRIYPGLIQEMEEATKELYDDAYAKWPERTGFSKRELNYGVLFNENVIEAYIDSPAKYTKYIHEKWPFNRVFVWQELLIKPFKKKVKILTKSLVDIIAKKAVGK